MRSAIPTSLALACAAAATAVALHQPLKAKAVSASSSQNGSPAANPESKEIIDLFKKHLPAHDEPDSPRTEAD